MGLGNVGKTTKAVLKSGLLQIPPVERKNVRSSRCKKGAEDKDQRTIKALFFGDDEQGVQELRF